MSSIRGARGAFLGVMSGLLVGEMETRFPSPVSGLRGCIGRVVRSSVEGCVKGFLCRVGFH